MKKIRFYNIVWDTDGRKVDLPCAVTREIDDDEMDVSLEGADVLSDEFGWCVESFQFVEEPIDPIAKLEEKLVLINSYYGRGHVESITIDDDKQGGLAIRRIPISQTEGFTEARRFRIRNSILYFLRHQQKLEWPINP
jgi:hypothetical protein